MNLDYDAFLLAYSKSKSSELREANEIPINMQQFAVVIFYWIATLVYSS